VAIRPLTLGLLASLLLTGSRQPQAAPAAAQASPAPAGSQLQGTVTRYCAGCHNDRLTTGGLSLQGIDPARPGDHPDVWEKVVRKLRSAQMPPPGLPHPDAAVTRSAVDFLRTELDRASAGHPNPGRPLLHRMNRAEYANAIRDLLDLEVDVAALLPPDDSGYGFDNIADLLGVSPVIIERYLAAAGRISDLAVGDMQMKPIASVYRVRQDASQDQHVEGLPLGTIGGLGVRQTLPLDGEYELAVKLFRTNLGTMRGLEYGHTLEIAVDGVRVHTASFGGNEEVTASSDNPTTTANAVDDRLKVRVPLTAGPHVITAAFLPRAAVQGTRRLQPWVRSSSDTVDFAGYPHVNTFTVSGPFDPTGPGDTPSRHRIFVCHPAASARTQDETACARRILSTLARRAYRGTATDADVDRLLAFYREERGRSEFERGIAVALRRLLTSPKFLFPTEHDPANVAPGSTYRVSDLELASRLSFFLWSSIPDDQLLDLAARGRLRNPGAVAQQVTRMLADKKSVAILQNFVGQYLYLRNLPGQVPNSNEFPDFDDNLRHAFAEESRLFFDSIMREDRSVLDLLAANYTFVNERLARHYGIGHVYGSQFRRVTLPDSSRAGILGQGSLLMATSHADRTSPVRRGKWILENVLGAPPPAPPDVVPPLKEKSDLAAPTTMRALMEEHRANPACASCHRLMDPVGLALENFDAVGAWRVHDEGNPIDASTELADGTHVDGPTSLRAALLRDPTVFVETFTEKFLTFALGRGVTAEDMPAVRKIVRDAARDNYRFSSLLTGIVESVPFQMRLVPKSESE
jgi:mono/diheme cytochrome c family protein